MAEVPQWFTSEVARRLRKVRRAAGSLQHYACCPVPAHGDQHASMGIRPGDKMTLVFFCQKGCSETDIRDALASLGVPDEYLGAYGTPEYQAVRRARVTSEERRKLDRVAILLHEPLTPAMLKIRIQAVIEGVEVPADRKEFLALAVRAGVSQTRRYEAWAQFCAARATSEPVSVDHVVLTHPTENRQAAQHRADVQIPETGSAFPERENGQTGNTQVAALLSECPNSRNGKTDETDKALDVLRSAGIVPSEPAA